MPFYTYDYERLSRAADRLREERWRCHAPIEAFAVTEDDGTVGARPPRDRGGGAAPRPDFIPPKCPGNSAAKRSGTGRR